MSLLVNPFENAGNYIVPSNPSTGKPEAKSLSAKSASPKTSPATANSQGQFVKGSPANNLAQLERKAKTHSQPKITDYEPDIQTAYLEVLGYALEANKATGQVPTAKSEAKKKNAFMTFGQALSQFADVTEGRMPPEARHDFIRMLRGASMQNINRMTILSESAGKRNALASQGRELVARQEALEQKSPTLKHHMQQISA